jgi:hypothetical protein
MRLVMLITPASTFNDINNEFQKIFPYLLIAEVEGY